MLDLIRRIFSRPIEKNGVESSCREEDGEERGFEGNVEPWKESVEKIAGHLGRYTEAFESLEARPMAGSIALG